MEKFSTWRDPGTGIQPFLSPVPPLQSTPLLVKLYLPFGLVIGALRVILLLVPALLYGIGSAISLAFTPLPLLGTLISGVFTSISSRLALLITGIWWIPVETVTRKRGRGAPEVWRPIARDIIVSNWASWIELLWLAFRWNPIFVLPVAESPSTPEVRPFSSNVTPGRRTGTGSAAISSPTPAAANKPRTPLMGWQRKSLLQMVQHCGNGVLTPEEAERSGKVLSLEEIRSRADRPVVVFPECTTSNGRGFLRFAEVFSDVPLPVKRFSLFVMCVRYDPPTMTSPSLTHSIPSQHPFVPNPLGHVFQLLSSPTLSRTLSIRLLAPSESPSSSTFMTSDFFSPGAKDQLGEAISRLIEYLGKFKRTSVMGWEEKASFLTFYKSKMS